MDKIYIYNIIYYIMYSSDSLTYFPCCPDVGYLLNLNKFFLYLNLLADVLT